MKYLYRLRTVIVKNHLVCKMLSFNIIEKDEYFILQAGLSPDKFMLLEEPEAVLKYYSINANEYPTKLPACYRCIVLQVGGMHL